MQKHSFLTGLVAALIVAVFCCSHAKAQAQPPGPGQGGGGVTGVIPYHFHHSLEGYGEATAPHEAVTHCIQECDADLAFVLQMLIAAGATDISVDETTNTGGIVYQIEDPFNPNFFLFKSEWTKAGTITVTGVDQGTIDMLVWWLEILP